LLYSISIAFPKYAFILTNHTDFLYRDEAYWFYRKRWGKHLKFYLLHVVGENATKIEGKDQKWVAY
jgi:hypothetical protein